MFGRVILRRGGRGLVWALAWLAATAPISAEARCTFGGNSLVCVDVGGDGSTSVTTFTGNSVFTNNSNGDYSWTTNVPGLRVTNGGNSEDGTTWSRTTTDDRTTITWTAPRSPGAAAIYSGPAAPASANLDGLPASTYVCLIC